MDDNNIQLCVICGEVVCGQEALRRPRESGIQTLIESSILRGDDEVRNRLFSTDPPAVKFHQECRKRYTDKRTIAQVNATQSDVPPKRRLRIDASRFHWQQNCFLCGKEALIDERHPERIPVFEVRTTDPTRNNLLRLCESDHPWSVDVKDRLNDCIDLVAVEARYHSSCYKDFTRRRPSYEQVGRPTHDVKLNHFNSLCTWLEEDSEAEVFSLDELWWKMYELSGAEMEDDVWSKKWLKSKLRDRYGEHIFFADIGGSRKEAVCFRNMASYIVNERWYSERSCDEETEKKRIIKAAAKIIREDIRAAEYDKCKYPAYDDISDRQKMREFVVPSLMELLDVLLNNELVGIAIGQAITQAARPRSVIAPVLFGLGVDIDHVFGSKWAVKILYALGFSVSPDEVSLYKNNIMQDEGQYSLGLNAPTQDQSTNQPTCVQYAADNADANIATLLGDGTFHGTGIIRWNRKTEFDSRSKSPVIRRARVKESELCQDKGIQMLTYVRRGASALSQVKFVPLSALQCPYVIDGAEYYSTLLWRTARALGSRSDPIPRWMNWGGYVQSVFWKDGQDASVDNIHIMPLLDLNPNDDITIYSVLSYLDREVKAASVPCTTVTFDQPLYIKAMEIKSSVKYESIVVRLGGFHTLMSAIAAAFHIMKASGVEEAMEEVYGPNVVQHIMTGKSIARSLRILHLLDAALYGKLMEYLLPERSSDLQVEALSEDDLNALSELLANSMELSTEVCVEEHPSLHKLDVSVEQLKNELSETSRTAKLWVQFLYHISVIKNFVFAERSKNWEAHLYACSKLLSLFAACGRIHYAKSCRLYLQNMRELPQTHPWLYRMYTEKKMHAVQRTEHALNGLWTDLTIEQVLMASMKSSGGLTHGRGLTESVRHQWVYTMHHRVEVHRALSVLTKTRRITSSQHEELNVSRRKHDEEDLEKISQWFHDHNPFETGSDGLRSLSSGITATAENDVNCDVAEEVGCRIQMSLDNEIFSDAKLQKKDRIKTFQDLKPGVSVGKKTVHIEPATLFMRCVELSKRLSLDSSAFFDYELCAEPVSLFKDNFMYKTDKSKLAGKMLSNVKDRSSDRQPADYIVIDGGWLIHKVSWKRRVQFKEIIDQYSMYVKSLSNNSKCVVVFDGYDASIKDHEHSRRCEGKSHCDVNIKPETVNKYDQGKFLLNIQNKKRVITLLEDRLKADGHSVIICSADADVTIAKTCLELSMNKQNVDVVCSDTDILCMLVYHVHRRSGDPNSGTIIFRKEPQRNNRKTGGMYSVNDITQSMYPSQADAILFLHAWSGCDTTSGFYGRGKLELYNLIPKSKRVQEIAKEMDEFHPPEKIGQLGSELVSYQYGDVQSPTDLSTLRYTKFTEIVAKCSKFDPRALPPTTRAAQFHSMRCHLQVIRWKHLDDELLDERIWGWSVNSDKYVPIPTDMPAAPENVLNYIRCKCKRLNNKCGNNICSCRKHGLKCVEACAGCHGRDCNNVTDISLEGGSDMEGDE